jgi:hypothetical protein
MRTLQVTAAPPVLADVGGYLIASRPDEQPVAAVDPDTGQVRRELGTWQDLHPDSVTARLTPPAPTVRG